MRNGTFVLGSKLVLFEEDLSSCRLGSIVLVEIDCIICP